MRLGTKVRKNSKAGEKIKAHSGHFLELKVSTLEAGNRRVEVNYWFGNKIESQEHKTTITNQSSSGYARSYTEVQSVDEKNYSDQHWPHLFDE